MVTLEKEPTDMKEDLIKFFQDECLNIIYDDIDNAMIGLGKAPLNLRESNDAGSEPAKGETTKK